MRKVFVDPVVLPEPRFRDGLGIRYVRTDGTDDPVEVLRPLWDVGAMQNAIRQRVSRLATFRQARFVPVRAAEVPRDDASTIEVISDYVAGHRLSQYLEASQVGVVSVEPSAAIYILRELLGALALLHESRGVTHGAVGPERILITPKGRVVVADYVLGPAIERLEFTRPRLWREFRIPLPAGKGTPRLDDKADVMQVGVTALALLVGRPIDLTEYPDRVDALVASLSQTNRSAGRSPLSATLIGWLRRALSRDPNGRFANVSDARLTLEGVLSGQDAPAGGATALKAMAETFGRYAADLEAKAAAAAAEDARKAAVAAEAALREALEEQAADAAAAAPLSDLVPAFTLLSDTPASSPDGLVREAESAAVPDSDPPVGWRVPEPPPVEETLPTSPLIQIDAPLGEPAAEDFVEEVLDLSALTGPDEDDLASADDALLADAAPPLVVQADTLDPALAAGMDAEAVEVVDLRDSAATESALETADAEPVAAEPIDVAPAALETTDHERIALETVDVEPAALETADIAPAVFDTAGLAAAPTAEVEPTAAIEYAATDLCEEPAAPVPSVEAALAALAALDVPAPAAAPEALPEWRLLADPLGAIAPTIDVEEPTESLEELVAEFAATRPIEGAPAEPVEPAAMVEAPASLMAAAEEPAPASERPSVLDEILGLQEAQAAAQAAVEPTPEPAAAEADIAAWSFVEELVHHDARFEVRADAEVVPQPVVEESDLVVEHSEPVVEQYEPAVEEAEPAITAPAVIAEDAVVAPAAADEELAPALPPDWLIEVGSSSIAEPPEPLRRVELDEDPPELPEKLPAFLGPPRAVERQPPIETVFAEEITLPPAVSRPVPEAPEEDETGPVFPRVAPSVRRVRAEARRRRLARISSSAARLIQLILGAFTSGARAIGNGVTQSIAVAGRGTAVAGRALLAGAVLVATAVSRAIGGTISAVATGAAALARGAAAAGRGAASAGAGLARAAGSAARSAASGAARALAAAASGLTIAAGSAARATAAVTRAAGHGLSSSARGLAAGLGALGRAGSRVAVGTARSAASASAQAGRTAAQAVSAVASGASAAAGLLGRGAVLAGKGTGRAVAYAASVFSSAAGLLGRGAALTGSGITRAAGRAASSTTAMGTVAGRGFGRAATGILRAAFTIPRKLYFVATDVADWLPKPLFRPWYLAAALVVIVAVAGVPYARAWLFTEKPAVGTIRVESARPDALVSIDGVPHGTAPLTAEVPVGRHRIEVSSAGRTRAHDVDVAAGREALVQAAGTDLKATGSIRVTTEPAGAEVLIDGVLHGRAPLTVDNITEGTHTVLVRDGSGSVRQTVRVRENETDDATIPLRPGWLAVFAPVKLEVLENGRSIGSTEGGRILTPPGPHTIEVVSQAMGFRETRQVEIKPGAVAAVTIAMPPATIEVVAPAESEILIDGRTVGTAPLGPLQAAVGTREIVMRHPTLGERRQVVSVTYNAPVRVVFD